MKKAFTLVELMVVVVVIVTLLTITFRLVSVGEDASKRNTTIARMERLENALSGYFAAFGSYPPVELHASRYVYAKLDENGNQTSEETASLDRDSVDVACRAQPVAARFPFTSHDGEKRPVEDYVATVARIVVDRINSDDEQWSDYKNYRDKLGNGFEALNDPNQVDNWRTKTYWQEVKVFQFGVMSFLLPRYLFMSNTLEPEQLEDCAQWTANNRLSAHPNAGYSFTDWRTQLSDMRLVKRIPSQSVCARWMPNFEKMVTGNPFAHKGKLRFFGVDVSDGFTAIDPDNPWELAKNVYPEQGRTILDSMTVRDGWGNEFYYYSPPPFQSYRIWSAGPNGATFPPWMPFSALKSDADRKTASEWMADDIMYLSN